MKSQVSKPCQVPYSHINRIRSFRDCLIWNFFRALTYLGEEIRKREERTDGTPTKIRRGDERTDVTATTQIRRGDERTDVTATTKIRRGDERTDDTPTRFFVLCHLTFCGTCLKW